MLITLRRIILLSQIDWLILTISKKTIIMTKKIRIARLKVFFKKHLRDTFHILDRREHLTDIQKKTLTIIRKMITNDNSLLLISPISKMYTIENGNILIRFGENGCYIINSKYSYYVYLPASVISEVAHLFSTRLEGKTNKIVNVYEKKTIQSLDDIINSIIPNT